MSSKTKSTCPQCKTVYNLNKENQAECDNACGTWQCLGCGEDCFYDWHAKKVRIGHEPTCGLTSSDEEEDTDDEQ